MSNIEKVCVGLGVLYLVDAFFSSLGYMLVAR